MVIWLPGGHAVRARTMDANEGITFGKLLSAALTEESLASGFTCIYIQRCKRGNYNADIFYNKEGGKCAESIHMDNINYSVPGNINWTRLRFDIL